MIIINIYWIVSCSDLEKNAEPTGKPLLAKLNIFSTELKTENLTPKKVTNNQYHFQQVDDKFWIFLFISQK